MLVNQSPFNLDEDAMRENMTAKLLAAMRDW
jgi:hypothetical protein